MSIARRVAIVVTLRCNLNCKLCCNLVPHYTKENKPIIPKEDIISDIKALFELYEEITWLQFVGGELFLHPNMGDIIKEALKYSSQFEKLILMVNGGIMPNANAMEGILQAGEKIQVQISDYGILSPKLKELETLLEAHNIDFVTKSFHGDIQHYGGWVDCGGFENRNYTKGELSNVFESCWQRRLENLHCYKGKLHNCIRSLFYDDLGEVIAPDDEYIDLRSNNKTIAEKRAIADGFGKHVLNACKYCGGFDSENAQRFPAAEQVGE